MRVEVQWFEGCPHAAPTRRTLREVVARLAPDAEVIETLVRDEAHAQALGFQGSPSIRVDGRDLEGREGPSLGLACRLYPGGAPPEWLVEAALLRALRPQGFLFLCVANSARSQIAEGVARSLAPDGVAIASAGSAPSMVRPEAVVVLAERGIDASGQRSKGMKEVDAAAVEAVVTLCAEEVCPVWLGHALRVHWGLPDPAAVEGEGRLEAFRTARDELEKRLAAVFEPQGSGPRYS
jgi:arsenate reductase